MSAKLIFYDIACTQPNVSWSPNTLKTRIALNVKGIPFETKWLAYENIASNHKELGIQPSEADPVPYNCPAIKHGDVCMQDSDKIIEYLEANFPDTPKVFPHPGTRALCKALALSVLKEGMKDMAVPKLIFPKIPDLLGDEGGAEYFRTTRTKRFNTPLADFCKEEERPQLLDNVASFGKLAQVLLTAEDGPYLAGKDISYGDVQLMAFLRWFELSCPEVFKTVCDNSPAAKELHKLMSKYC